MRTKTDSGKAKPGHCNLVDPWFTIQILPFNYFSNSRCMIYETEVSIWKPQDSHFKVVPASLCTHLVVYDAWLMRHSLSKRQWDISKKHWPAVAGCEGQISGYGYKPGYRYEVYSLFSFHCSGCCQHNVIYWLYPDANRALFSQTMLCRFFFVIDSKTTVK